MVDRSDLREEHRPVPRSVDCDGVRNWLSQWRLCQGLVHEFEIKILYRISTAREFIKTQKTNTSHEDFYGRKSPEEWPKGEQWMNQVC
jgi:hypothetical protein